MAFASSPLLHHCFNSDPPIFYQNHCYCFLIAVRSLNISNFHSSLKCYRCPSAIFLLEVLMVSMLFQLGVLLHIVLIFTLEVLIQITPRLWLADLNALHTLDFPCTLHISLFIICHNCCVSTYVLGTGSMSSSF